MDAVKLARLEGLKASLIDLQHQAATCEQLTQEGVQRWAGTTPQRALIDTAKAMIHDVVAYENINGSDAWSDEKRQYANRILKGE